MKIDHGSTTRIIRLNDVKLKTGLSRSAIYSAMKEMTFPRAVSIGVRSIGWVEGDVDLWIITQIEKSRTVTNANLKNSSNITKK